MKGDYSRITFNPKKHYSDIRVQQGRVQTDADLNEQFDLTRHRMETEVKDFIGQSGFPEENPGFAIKVEEGKVRIGKGRGYVEGILLENEEDLAFAEQKDSPGSLLPEQDGIYLAYLDVWRKHLTAIEEPDLQDAALGNQDTTARLKNLWQVKLARLGEKDLLLNEEEKKRFQPGVGWSPNQETQNPNDLPLSTGRLKAQVTGTGATLGNQLYRVEIHTPGQAGGATFKWSRDNASFAGSVTTIIDQEVTLRYVGRGMEEGFKVDDQLEITNDQRDLLGLPGILAKVSQVNQNSLNLSISEEDRASWYAEIVGSNKIADKDRLARLHTRARHWEAASQVEQNQWIKLERGIEVQFGVEGATDAPYYKSGDFWLIPSRSLMKDIYWERDPGGNPLFQPAYGTPHYFACLALLARSNASWEQIADLRVPFNNVTKGLLSKKGDTVTGDMTFEKSLKVEGGIGIGMKPSAAGLDVNGNITAEIIYARSIRSTKYEGGIERVIETLEERIQNLEQKLGIEQ